MSGGNFETRVKQAVDITTGPLPGSGLLQAFKQELVLDPVMKVLFGNNGERIFIDKMPNLNESIVPCLFLSWKSEIFMSGDTYLEGTVDAALILPTKLMGNFNELRNVAQIFQRFIGGTMNIFPLVPGLVRFGFNSNFDYGGLAAFDGFTCPLIQVSIPYRFDLQLLRIQMPDFDPTAALNEADLGWIEEFRGRYFNSENNETLIAEGVILETGQEN